MKKHDVFISYSRKDSKVAQQICNQFDNAGISYFIDIQDIGGAMEFPIELSNAICNSKLFLFLASENSYRSKFTTNELTFAFNELPKHSILPYIIDGSDLPRHLRFVFAGINWRNIKDHPINTSLINDIKALLNNFSNSLQKVSLENPGIPSKVLRNEKNHLQEGYILAGRYRIDRCIGRGGFSCTYVATDLNGDEGGGVRVAVKEMIMRDYSTRGDDGAAVVTANSSRRHVVQRVMSKFLEEARFLQSISFPHIVHVSDYFHANNTAYYVMDYIDGESLADKVKRGPLPEDTALRYITQVAHALKQVHNLNRLHLNVKPANILVDNKDNVVLIDFGASKQYDEVDGENSMTPGYAPLEQMSNDVVQFFPSTDIYALGATLYKLLTGLTPLSANMLAAGEERQPLPANVSATTAKAIKCSMSLKRSERPQSIDEFLELLKGVDSEAHENKDDNLEVIMLSTENEGNGNAEAAVIGDKSMNKNESGKGAVLDLPSATKSRVPAGERKNKSFNVLIQNPVTRWIVVGAIAAIVAVLVTFAVLYFTNNKHKSTSSPSTTTAATSTSASSSSADADTRTQINDADQKAFQRAVNEFNASYAGRKIADAIVCKNMELNGNTLVLNFVLSDDVKLTDKDIEDFKNEFAPQTAPEFMREVSQDREAAALIKRNKMNLRVNLYQGDRLLASSIASLTNL